VKYIVRRAMHFLGVAFATALEVTQFCQRCSTLTAGSNGAPGAGLGLGVFFVAVRHFLHISEADVQDLQFCTSPKFVSEGARGQDDLATKADVFCIRPDLNPPVRVLKCQPVALGMRPSDGDNVCVEPYKPATLNSLQEHEGWWRHLSCACRLCLRGTMHVPGADQHDRCTANGVYPSAWVPYSVARRPPNPKKQGRSSYIFLFLQGFLEGKAGAERERYIDYLSLFVRSHFRRFQTDALARKFVEGV
jgi:hypothetical protein